MAFSDIELQYIDLYVGKLCKRRSPPHLSDKIRTTYEIKNHDVIVFEERPHFQHPHEWSKIECAKFKYDRTNKKWKLYWMRKDLKWHLCDPETGRTDLETLVRVVDTDPYGAFFG